MRKPKGIRRPSVESKSPGAAPKSTHPGKNLGKHLYPPKAKGVGPAKKLNVTAKRVADDITKSKHMRGY